MDPIFKKLNFKDHKNILVVNAPESFQLNMEAMSGFTRFFLRPEELAELEFALVFATRQEEINAYASLIAPKLKGDAILWFCYPKGTSKKYACDFNRDTGWAIMGNFGLEPVRMVAIDEDWSALRFRKVAYIKTITRSEKMALTDEAKKRTTKKPFSTD